MKKIFLIGMGPGLPEFLTVQAIETLKRIHVFFMLEKEGRGKEELLRMRRDILDLHLGKDAYRLVVAQSPSRRMASSDYNEGVKVWHDEKHALFQRLIDEELEEGQNGALLLWGDPAIYDQTVSLVSDLASRSEGRLDFEIVPGITSVQMLAARHRIPLNRVGESITITTGRHAENCDPATIDNAVVMLDYNASFQRFRDQDMDLYWGGYLGCEDEILVSGPVDEITDDLLRIKSEVREKKGWLMDIYLLRRRKDER
ncbi:precorrin-6A synthase (deacetylating) [Imhoffiella purpurea]|uniref:Precorrin-6A synthase n=1 Tax=Imhoffiella purpurea TaxID=1249627 RepID=W9VBS3_9GAMM|nr:precorrin-6A synthase (deacetylating) [Imhoffiella purpurea]EXJ17038.1 Precorrin-6A synthase [Imhoffiella purpurea]